MANRSHGNINLERRFRPDFCGPVAAIGG